MHIHVALQCRSRLQIELGHVSSALVGCNHNNFTDSHNVVVCVNVHVHVCRSTCKCVMYIGHVRFMAAIDI